MPQHRARSPDPARSPPFGIGEQHIAPRSPMWLRNLLSLILIGGPLLAAMLGLLGGGAVGRTVARGSQATLSVESPAVLRSGNWFETVVTVEPAVDVADLTIAIDESLWRGMSIDTLAPDAEKSGFRDGRFSYSFGPVGRGERFVFKLDGQIQPRWVRRQSGKVAALDGERELAEVPLRLVVLP